MVHLAFEAARDHDLVLPGPVVVREHAANRLVAPAVAADGGESGRNVHQLALDAEMLRELTAALAAAARGILLRQQQAEYLVLADRAHGERRADRAVDAARHGDHQPAARKVAQDLAQAARDAVGFRAEVDVEDRVIELHASPRRRTLPVAVYGSVPAKTTSFGTLYIARC